MTHQQYDNPAADPELANAFDAAYQAGAWHPGMAIAHFRVWRDRADGGYCITSPTAVLPGHERVDLIWEPGAGYRLPCNQEKQT